jgi:hypothetical protein
VGGECRWLEGGKFLGHREALGPILPKRKTIEVISIAFTLGLM